jgi:hypothetical protein
MADLSPGAHGVKLAGVDIGDPVSNYALQQGARVYTSDGEDIGAVEHVLSDEELDVFDGIVFDGRSGPGGWRFADAELVAQIGSKGVVLTVDSAAAAKLPEPGANPSAIESHGTEDAPPGELQGKLQRAWDLISGKW